jgi:hypothetical protein
METIVLSRMKPTAAVDSGAGSAATLRLAVHDAKRVSEKPNTIHAIYPPAGIQTMLCTKHLNNKTCNQYYFLFDFAVSAVNNTYSRVDEPNRNTSPFLS